jgi:hypothetical protein
MAYAIEVLKFLLGMAIRNERQYAFLARCLNFLSQDQLFTQEMSRIRASPAVE